MHEATLLNVSSRRRQHWGVVTLPRIHAADLGVEATFETQNGRQFRAVRGRSVGCKTVYRVNADLGGHELVEGVFLPRPHEAAHPQLRSHPWVADDIHELIPTIGARSGQILGGGPNDKWAGDVLDLRLIDQSPAHQRWRLVRRIPEMGLHFVWWADVLDQDAVMPVWGKIVWSHRSDHNHNRSFDAMIFRAGEYVEFDFAERHGMQDSFPNAKGEHLQLLSHDAINLRDGSGLPLSGAMLAFISPKPDDPAPDPEDVEDWMIRTVNNLYAGAEGPILGVSHDWDGEFLACKNIPRFDKDYVSRADTELGRFEHDLKQRAGWFADRYVGTSRSPGQTGDQEDFGATKGTYAVTEHDPRAIRYLQYSVQAELFRGFNHYEDDGSILDPRKHPDWVTWSGDTHWHTGVSRDRLGKRTDVFQPPGTGWRNYDDQHRSQNNVAAYMALSDDPLMEDQILHHVVIDAAAYRIRFPNNGAGAARAQGRTAGAMAQLLAVTDGDTAKHLSEMLAIRMRSSVSNPSLQVPGPMKVLSHGGPDGRKDVFWPNGERAPFTVVWEHGLAAVGLYNEVKQEPDNEDAKAVLTAVCEFLARYGCFERNGKWHTVADLLYNGGADITGDWKLDNPAISAREGMGGVTTWTFAGLLVAREWLGSQHPDAGKLDACILALTGGKEASDRRTAEWWAAIRDINFAAAS